MVGSANLISKVYFPRLVIPMSSMITGLVDFANDGGLGLNLPDNIFQWNNGGIDGAVVVDIVADKPVNVGYNAHTGEYVDMYKAGVIDPVKVVRTALVNAASIAGLLLTTEGCISELPEEEKAPKYPTPPGGDMY